jgi:hypothetical protein
MFLASLRLFRPHPGKTPSALLLWRLADPPPSEPYQHSPLEAPNAAQRSLEALHLQAQRYSPHSPRNRPSSLTLSNQKHPRSPLQVPRPSPLQFLRPWMATSERVWIFGAESSALDVGSIGRGATGPGLTSPAPRSELRLKPPKLLPDEASIEAFTRQRSQVLCQ